MKENIIQDYYTQWINGSERVVLVRALQPFHKTDGMS